MSQSETDAANHTASSGKDSAAEENIQLTNRQVELILDTWSYVRLDLEKAGAVLFVK